ncbi:MAG: phosphatase PAP2 family protein [Actinomycetota bacterium]|nr:phosphatase PAP2 family protein [Actinomycetota bacterium]
MAVQTEREDPATPGTSAAPGRSERRRRILAITVYLVAVLVYWKTIGLPTDPVLIFLFLWVAIAAWNAAAPWREHLRFVRDWAPLIVVIVAYNFSRGAADNLGFPLHVTEPINADKWLTGWFTDGKIPTLWLQEHLYTPGHVHWYDVIGSFVYFSHFVTAMIVAAVLWVRSRSVWASFMRRFIALDVIGLAIYIGYPMAPPWWASEHGYLTGQANPGCDLPVHLSAVPRITNCGWDAIGLHSAGRLVTKGQGVANPVAAMPSLHSAFALFVVLFFILRIRKLWTLLLLTYPLAMGWVLMYFSEHYLIDIFAGWAVALVAMGLVGMAERLWSRRGRATDSRATERAAVASRG